MVLWQLRNSLSCIQENDYLSIMSPIQKPLVISHRTHCAGAPENSMAGIRAAVKLGVDKIELDVQRTRDGQLILMHDLDVKRTTHGSGKVKNLKAAEITKLRLVSKDHPEEKVPLLEEVFALVAPTPVGLLLEVKSPAEYPNIGTDLARLVERYGMKDRVEVLCFNWNFLRQLKQEHPLLSTCALSSLPFSAKSGDNFDALGIYFRSLLLRHSFGFSLPEAKNIYAGTPNSEKALRRLIEIGVEGIITDEPELLLTILNS